METQYILDARDILAWLASVPEDRVLGPFLNHTRCYGTCAARYKWGGFARWGYEMGILSFGEEEVTAYATDEACDLLDVLQEAEIYDSELGWHVTRRLLLEKWVVTVEELQEAARK